MTVSFLVAKSGKVQTDSVRIISAKPLKIFNQAVVTAVLNWRFAPVLKSFRTTQRVVFNLHK
ncbi:MAG: energy transducer TonB [Pseudomonadales bacterium]|nr:energy transducer TonB [Pseudomonadales bacterium]